VVGKIDMGGKKRFIEFSTVDGLDEEVRPPEDGVYRFGPVAPGTYTARLKEKAGFQC